MGKDRKRRHSRSRSRDRHRSRDRSDGKLQKMQHQLNNLSNQLQLLIQKSTETDKKSVDIVTEEYEITSVGRKKKNFFLIFHTNIKIISSGPH
jgi:hypothetical protein